MATKIYSFPPQQRIYLTSFRPRPPCLKAKPTRLPTPDTGGQVADRKKESNQNKKTSRPSRLRGSTQKALDNEEELMQYLK